MSKSTKMHLRGLVITAK